MEPRVLDQLLEATVLLQKDLARAFEGTPLTTARTHLLWTLRTGPMTQQALATALEVSPRNITGLVDALEASGYVARGAHPTDRRATVVSLTELGERTMAKMGEDHRMLSHDLVAGLERDDVDRLERGLDVVIDRLKSLMAADQATSEPGES
ncbi:MAG TPA: MarR family transcriptional regulator [Homoserinimonas sp.]|nr:MarR family transcriptional regulator [Homoserinimonas sp.]